MSPATPTAVVPVRAARPAEPMPQILRADARALPLADASVDLVVTSPPYYGLRSYQDGGRVYDGQLGGESTPAEYLDALLQVTAECVRLLKPSGSIWVNLGDRYGSGASGHSGLAALGARYRGGGHSDAQAKRARRPVAGVRAKSLLGLPWRYAIRCVDELGLTLRAELVWAKPNALPESVTDRVRRSHETWFHFTTAPRYYAAIDEIGQTDAPASGSHPAHDRSGGAPGNVVGRRPGSVWQIPTQPLRVPAALGIDHFAAFPMEWPRRLILGWSPRAVCTACGQGRRPVVRSLRTLDGQPVSPGGWQRGGVQVQTAGVGNWRYGATRQRRGYACACPDTTAPVTPGVVLDPFGGTGTTALVAALHGRIGISVDASADYCRLATWRASDPAQRAKAAAPAAPPTANRRRPCVSTTKPTRSAA